LKKARILKSQMEIEQLRITNEVACMGYEVAQEMVQAGVPESEIAGAVEGRIYGKGVGYKNVKRARGYCFVMSGANSVNSWRPFCVSSSKRLAWGEPVLVELDAMTNGYFNDLTRTFFVGKPDAKARRIFDVVQEAVNTVVDAVKPGVRAADLDAIARKVIGKAGYGEYFNHQLGHGIGLQFHEPPTLHPASQDVLEKGMVFAIEPAIYIPGFGGVRLEENIVVTDSRGEIITPFPQRVEE
jgi:Xaa-Pro aminopeptidase